MANESLAKRQATVFDYIQSAKDKIFLRLPKDVRIDKERFFLGLMTAIQKSKATAQAGKSLADCDPGSVLLAAYEAAEVGCPLMPNLQLGWLIPYGGQAQFQPSYRFFIQRAYETGDVKAFYAEVVYPGDQLDRQYAPKKNLFHAPGERKSMKVGDALGAYALIEYKDGTIDWEYLTAEQIGRHRDCSKQKNSMKWVEFWEEGWRITPIRVLAKRIPLKSPSMERLAEIINKDAENELAISIDAISTEPSVPRRASQAEVVEMPQQQQQTAEASQTAGSEAPAATETATGTAKSEEKKPETEAKPAEQNKPAGNGGQPEMFGDNDPFITTEQQAAIFSTGFGNDWKKAQTVEMLKEKFKVNSAKDLRQSQLKAVMDIVSKPKD